MYLTTEELVKIYNRRRVVNEVNLEVEKGEVVGLLGPNGAGKTTTFYMIVGVIRPNAGKIFFSQKEISYLPMYKRAQLGIGYLSQDPSVFRRLTVEENILLILEEMKMSRVERKERVNSLLNEFNLTHLRKYLGYMLSGGERRKVEIARALASSPSFLLLDEPFTGIDPIAIADIQEAIAYLRKKGLGILITDHNVRDTLSIVDRAYIMHEGKILISGSAEEVAKSEIARRFYLGEEFSL